MLRVQAQLCLCMLRMQAHVRVHVRACVIPFVTIVGKMEKAHSRYEILLVLLSFKLFSCKKLIDCRIKVVKKILNLS